MIELVHGENVVLVDDLTSTDQEDGPNLKSALFAAGKINLTLCHSFA